LYRAVWPEITKHGSSRMTQAFMLWVGTENTEKWRNGRGYALVPIVTRAVMHYLEDANSIDAFLMYVSAQSRQFFTRV
jgi:hypothetical protein